VQRGRDLLSEGAGDPAIEDQLDLLGAAQIEVLTDHLLEEQAAVHRPIEYCVSENSACRIERS